MRMIDGEKLIEDLRRYKHEVISVDGLEGIISLMPSTEPEQRWISVSERLPEKGTYCLICTEDGYVDVDTYYLYGWDDFGNVIAWQPFPDPYQEEPT